MFLKNIFYFIAESWKGLFRNGWMSLASIGVVALTLFMLSVFVLINLNVQHWAQAIKEEVEIVLYIDEEATSSQRETLRDELEEHSEVAEYEFVSREEALQRLEAQLGPRGDLLEGYQNPEENPLRDSYEVTTEVPEQVPQVARELRNSPGVAELFYGEDVVENLFSFTRVLQLAMMGLMVALAATATFLISHTIRLTVMLRKREIMIMKYVGATNWFIRWPFLLEGINLGILGTVLPLVGIYFGYQEIMVWTEANLYFLPPMVPLEEALTEASRLVVPLGMALGILGSIVSIGKYLKV